jgi:hypothetical protein
VRALGREAAEFQDTRLLVVQRQPALRELLPEGLKEAPDIGLALEAGYMPIEFDLMIQ